MSLKLAKEMRGESANDIGARSFKGCKKAGYKAATYLSELAQWKPLQTGRVHIKTMNSKNPPS
ncbi:hypothetical protein XBKQ1_400045 [Xenorhabdus bovienii str. kraussei Quebec]|uniref:Uncharacterized protein n=1 Tax=Xenorhabdus bovienii str. kraussei Quebec TaxID=1398203 RepID=A0A077PL73_XENBV|nr:hypothetical protein XBKQ1_400045 [Xenorhabdus bovienii str. kraussei Quebec]